MATQATAANTYDDVPYPSGPHPLSHPCHLAMIAALFDRPAPAVEHCRVLELGCAAGGNLIPMAQNFPDSQFLGIDLSPRQIADGEVLLDKLALRNIELRQMDITGVDRDFGAFDFIICHGVYSWVPRSVQDRILEIARDHLSHHGIMYVSYNTYPGWHMRGVVREMMRYHAASFPTAKEKLGQSRSLLKYLIDSATSSNETYRQILKDEAEHLSGHSDEYIYHEHLEETNEPLYFHQFIDRVSTTGLRYLGDAEYRRMMVSQFDDATAAILRGASLLRQEQYIDFLTARTFRRSLLCRDPTPIDRSVTAGRLKGLSISLAEPMQATGTDASEIAFTGQLRAVTTSDPVIQAVLHKLLRAWPAWITTEDLLTGVLGSLGASSSALDADILNEILILLSRGVVQAAVCPPKIQTQAGPAPLTTPWARLQSQTGVTTITNLRHSTVELDELSRFVLSRLDGHHDRGKLLDDLATALGSGQLNATRESFPVGQVERAELKTVMDRVLTGLAARVFSFRNGISENQVRL